MRSNCYSIVGGLTPNVTEADLKGRFSAVKNLSVKSVDIILREDGVCKGFAYVNTNEDDEDAIGKLIKLYNGSKWRGRVLKVEIAKPDYLARIKEEQEKKNAPKEEPTENTEETENVLPISGIENTIMIRKSKRKFLVVSLNTVHRNENGHYMGDSPAAVPRTVEVPVKAKPSEQMGETEEKPRSTKKHRFIQPEVTCFEDTVRKPVPSTDLWAPIEAPKRTNRIAQLYQPVHIVESSIKLDDTLVSESQPPAGLLSDSDEEPVMEERGVVTFSDHDEDIPAGSSMYYEASSEEEEKKEVDCCVEAVCQKREWSEKKAEIEAKRQRVELETVQEDEGEEDLENLNLQAENQKLTDLLHSMIGKQTTQPTGGIVDFDDETPDQAVQEVKPPVREETLEGLKQMGEKDQANEMQSLFDDKNVSSFSLFNFLPSSTPVTETPAQPEETNNILDTLAPTAWYNETKAAPKASMITIPVSTNTDTVISQQKHVRRDFSNFFYRTRSMEEVEKEWEQLRPGLVNDYERKKKNAKHAWKQNESHRRR